MTIALRWSAGLVSGGLIGTKRCAFEWDRAGEDATVRGDVKSILLLE